MHESMGTLLKIGAISISELTSIGGIEISADTIDTTTLDATDGYRRFAQGLKDAGEVSASGFFNPTDASGQLAGYAALNTGALTDFEIVFPSDLGASWSFQGIVTGFATNAELEDGIGFDLTIKVSGKPNLNVTPSAGLTNLSIAGAGGALSPGFSANSYAYAYTGVTATSVTVMATGAGQTIKLYVDGTYIQDLQSGAASNPIALASIGASKKITILANEPGKTARTYEAIVVKSA